MSTKKPSLLFMGTPEFADIALQALIEAKYQIIAVVTMPDRPKGRGGKITESPVSITAKRNSIPLIKPVSKAELALATNELNFDLIIVAAYGMIVPQNILDIPKLGAFNIHGSLLPRYRGASPIAAAILNGDPEAGITIMKMAAEMDAGDMVAKDSLLIADNDTTGTLTKKLARLGANLLLAALPHITDGSIKPESQNSEQATFCPKIGKADGLISWEESAKTIERKIRAYNPWPSAYTIVGGKHIKITKAQVSDEKSLKPGQPSVLNRKLFIGSSDYSLEILELQPEGKKEMTAHEFLNGKPKLS